MSGYQIVHKRLTYKAIIIRESFKICALETVNDPFEPNTFV